MSGAVSVSEAPTIGLGNLVAGNVFFVPTHQRDYKWDRDRVEKFFDDLTDAIDRNDKFYFVGLMVFMQETGTGRLRVLDGQQRLATAIIIFSALRVWHATSLGDATPATRLQYDFIGRAEYGETEAKPKLTLNRNNNDNFQKYVVNGSPIISSLKSELKKINVNDPNYDLLDAIIYCHDRVTEIATKINDTGLAAKYFATFIKFVRDNLMVVRLTVPNESNAFRVFETLNDRGMDLSATDLLKNYLFGLAHDKSQSSLEQMEYRWTLLTAVLKDSSQEDFLKVFWTSRYGRTQLDHIFDAVKETYKTSEEAVNLAMDLYEASEHYVAIESAEDPLWAQYPEKVKEIIPSLHLVGSKQVRPVIMAAIKKFSKDEFLRLLRLLEVVIVRWQMIGGERTGAIEIQCAKLAEAVWKGEVASAKDALGVIGALYLDDKRFRSKFREKEGLSNAKAVYLLSKIEEHERGAKKGATGKELAPHKRLTLEHILPRNPGDDWKTVIDADHKVVDDCALRLGNMCLLTEAHNKEVARGPYSKKKPVYDGSELLTTNQAGTYAVWDRKAIENRQDWLASRAVTVWRFE